MLSALKHTIKVAFGVLFLLAGISLGLQDFTGLVLAGLGGAAFLSVAL
jgi:hypothetical protein